MRRAASILPEPAGAGRGGQGLGGAVPAAAGRSGAAPACGGHQHLPGRQKPSEWHRPQHQPVGADSWQGGQEQRQLPCPKGPCQGKQGHAQLGVPWGRESPVWLEGDAEPWQGPVRPCQRQGQSKGEWAPSPWKGNDSSEVLCHALPLPVPGCPAPWGAPLAAGTGTRQELPAVSIGTRSKLPRAAVCLLLLLPPRCWGARSRA